jgi:hypothetical protein
LYSRVHCRDRHDFPLPLSKQYGEKRNITGGI